MAVDGVTVRDGRRSIWMLRDIGALYEDGFFVETWDIQDDGRISGPYYVSLDHPEMPDSWLQEKIGQISGFLLDPPSHMAVPIGAYKGQERVRHFEGRICEALDYLFEELGRRADKIVLT